MTTRTIGSKTANRPIVAPLSTISRFAAAIVGGYAFTYGFTALATLTGFVAGLPFSEARVLAWMIGALVYLGALLWAFVPRTSARAWLVLAGGGAAMGAAAWAVSRWMM